MHFGVAIFATDFAMRSDELAREAGLRRLGRAREVDGDHAYRSWLGPAPRTVGFSTAWAAATRRF